MQCRFDALQTQLLAYSFQNTYLSFLRSTVKLIKLWTPEIFMECYCDARNKPMRCEITKPQTASVISFWFWGLLAYSELYCDWPEHNQHSRKFSGVHGFLSLTQNNRLRNQNISQSNRASGKSHLVLRHFVIFMSFIVFIGLNKASMRIDTTSLNFELLSPVTFNEVGDISSSIWKRI